MNIGLVGTGFIARNFAREVGRRRAATITKVLTRRPRVDEFDTDILTRSIDELVAHGDVVVECSGDPLWATEVVAAAVDAGVPVVTMNTEFHITTGSAFVGKGLVTEAAGDQPGCLAELHEEAVAMGFEPVAYGNMKGFLNPDPTPEEMEYWGKKQGISLSMVTAFTDGTKVEAEQILVGNHFGATIGPDGMEGAAVDDLSEGAARLAALAEQVGQPVTDFVVSPHLSHGVFIVATHDPAQADALRYYKMGDGPSYTLVRPNIFVHLEILKTVRRVLSGGGVLLDNSASPELSLAAVAKRDLRPGERILRGIGSFDVRGRAIRIAEHPDHIPIGLLCDAVVERPVPRGGVLTMADVSVPESLALRLWRGIVGGRRDHVGSESGRE